MKFSAEVLIEIVSIVQEGIVNETDVSQILRDIDVQVQVEGNHPSIILSEEYKKAKGRI